MRKCLSSQSGRPDRSQSLALHLIRRNVEIKARIVRKTSAIEVANARVLNFGHTVGHAIERAGDYGISSRRSGEPGNGCGMRVSMKKAGLSPGNAMRRSIFCDVRFADAIAERFSARENLRALPFDKKFENGKVRFVVRRRIGSAYLRAT